MAAGYHFTVKLSTVFKSYFTSTRVACATRVKRLTRFLARPWLAAAQKLLHVRMSWNATYVRARPRVIPLANDHKKLPACLLGRLLVWVWGSTLAAFGRKGVPLIYYFRCLIAIVLYPQEYYLVLIGLVKPNFKCPFFFRKPLKDGIFSLRSGLADSTFSFEAVQH